MKHFTQTTANGLCTPPCGSSQSKSTSFSLFTSLLLFFLLFVGSNAAWADTFTAGETFFFDLRNAPWYNDGAYFVANFYNSNDEWLTQSSVSETSAEHVYSFSIPDRNDINRIQIDRKAPDHGTWGWTIKMTAEAIGTNNCIYMPSWTDNPVSCNWTTFNPATANAHTGNLFIVGTCTYANWEPNNAQNFVYHGDAIYTWEGLLKDKTGDNDGFKFLTARNWDNYFGPSNANVTGYNEDGARWTARYSLDPTTTSNQSMSTTNLVVVKGNCSDNPNGYVDRKWRSESNRAYYRITVDLSDKCDGKMTIVKLADNSNLSAPDQLWYVGPGLDVAWNNNQFTYMNNPERGVFWRKGHFKSSDDFKFMTQNAWGNMWGSNANPQSITIPNSDGYQLRSWDGNGDNDKKFRNPSGLGDDTYYNIVCDFVSEANPQMYIYPADQIFLDMGGTRYAMTWDDMTGNYTCSTEIPASTTFRFCMNSNGTGTFGAASANTEIGNVANDNAKIVRNGTNYYTTPNNKKITGLTLHLATRQLTITSVADVAVIPDVTLETKEYYLTGDLWDVCKNFMGYTKDAEAWVNAGSDDNLPFMAHLQKNGLNTEAQLTFVAPPIQFRFDLEEYRGTADYSKLQKDNIWDAENSNVTNNGSSEKHKFNLQDGTYEITIKYTAAGKLTVNKQAYTPTPKVGYKVILDEDEVGTLDSDGAYTIYNMSTGDHTLRISDGTTGKICGINWWGGLYFDKTNSSTDVISFAETTYHGTDASKFAPNPQPVVAKYNSTGKFNLSAESDIRVSFDGGKIVLTATEPAVPAVTHTVTFDSNGGSSVANQEVEDGGKAIQPANPTKSGYTFNYWKLSGESTEFDFNTTITGNITLVADWSAVPAVSYDGSEIFYFHKTGGSLEWGSVYGGDAAVFLEFSNTNGSSTARSTKIAYFWDTDNTNGDILATRVPAGTWNKVRVKRYGWNTGNQTLGGDYNNNSNWVTLENGKNYLNNSNTMAVYSNPRTFHFYISGSTALANTGSEFNAWNGNGTAHSGSITKTLNAGNEYKFKLNPTGTQDWRSEFNWNDIDAANSSNNINLRKNPANNNTEIWFDLSRKSDVTIACNGSKVTVNATPYYNVTFNSDGGSAMAAQELRSGEYATDPGTPSRGSGYTFNFWKLSGESSAYDFSTPVTSDIELVADWTAPTLYTVTFDSNGGSEVDAQEVVENETATEPADPKRDNYTFGGWKLGNVLYDFDTPVTDDIELVADWTYAPAHISSVSINESSIYTWEGDATIYTLVPTLVPGDIASVTVSWSSSDNNVATVENGVITPQRAGTATITCIATDYYSGSQTATCAVKVAPCAKALADAPSYSVTITGYNSYEGGSATLTGLWNSSEPENITVYHLTVTPNSGGKRYLYADASDNYVKRNTSSSAAEADNYYWIRTNVGTTGSSLQIFTLQNYGILKNEGTNAFLSSASSNAITTNWGAHRAIVQEDGTANVAKWHFIDGCGAKMMNMAFSNGDNNYSTHETFLHVDTELGYGDIGMTMSDESIVAVGSSDNCQDRSAHRPALEGAKSVPNPAYIPSQMNSSYYRMKENATVQANLGSALAEADVISVELYADAATSVTLCKTNGDVVATINLNADAATEYTYLVTAGTMLDGESAFIIKAADNHAGIRSIAVTPMVTESPAQPDLHWTTTPVTAHLLLDGNFTYTAASNDSQGAISYASEDIDVAQVDASTGEVTPSGAGTTNIIATITADECYTTYSISYEVSFLGLQDYINTDGVNSVTLPGDYTSENIVINKPFTIDGGGHAIGNLKVENEGDLTLSSALTVADFTICAKAGNTTTPAASGQVRNATNLTVNGEAYFLYTVDPSGHVQYGWYDFTVPFRVNVMTGIAGIENEVLNEDFVNERNYAIMEHLGEKQAAGEYAYKKFRGVMEPCRLYSITLDPQNNYNTIRFQKADGDLVADNSVTLNSYSSAVDDKHANWNGVGNGTLHHADAGLSVATIQVYQSGNKTFLPVDKNEYSLVVGSAFMVQETGTMTLNQATHSPLLAPKRAASVQPTAIQIASEGQPFSDQLFISADEMAGQGYTQGVDVAKAGNIGNVNVPQIWTNAYNSKLCAHEAQLINGEASYTLSLYAPANGSYTLTSKNIPEGYTLYLTQNGNKIWDMSDAYVIDLTKGTTNEYGLLLVERYNAPTGIENGEWTNGEAQKVLRNGVLYIIRNGEVYDAQGARVK